MFALDNLVSQNQSNNILGLATQSENEILLQLLSIIIIQLYTLLFSGLTRVSEWEFDIVKVEAELDLLDKISSTRPISNFPLYFDPDRSISLLIFLIYSFT